MKYKPTQRAVFINSVITGISKPYDYQVTTRKIKAVERRASKRFTLKKKDS